VNQDRNSESQIVPGEPLILVVGSSIVERRIDKYLHHRIGGYSRVMIQEIISAGGVKVNGKLVTKQSHKLRDSDRIEMTAPPPPPKEIPPEDIPLQVIYEDDDFLIINKPAGMLVHPAKGNLHGTLVNALSFYSDKLSSGLGEFRPGVVHRLDKNTTGVIVVTKNETAQWKIAKQFEHRQTYKEYLAIVHGTPALQSDRISAPLGMHPTVRQKYSIRPYIGKEAITFYEIAEKFRGFSLMRMFPKTGRTHQIRVHLSYIKHPIVADDWYGGKLVYLWQLKDGKAAIEDPIIKRTALHAHKLGFTHPTTGKHVEFEAPLPPDMQNLLDLLRKYRKIQVRD
jgi:23S rRNA pseudouridine1911/1915/1917 synthase